MEQENKWIRDILRHGSRPAADNLIRAHYDEIYVFVYRQVGNKEDAMDLTQSIFLAVLRSLPSFDPRKASFRTWLYRIATNKVIDARRRPCSHVVPLDCIELSDSDDFTTRVQDRVLLEQIERYVSSLDSQIQVVFRLHLYGEKSFPEIAAALGQSESAIKSQYYRLIGRLRKEFGADE